MHDVFISYSSKDKRAADAVCHALEADGIRCWIAPRDIYAGKDWNESILTAILNCKVCVLVLSQQSSNARQVQVEVVTAVTENRIVVPLRIEDIYPGGALRLQLAGTHWLDAFPPPLDPHLKKLSETLRMLMGEAPQTPARRPFPPQAPPPSSWAYRAPPPPPPGPFDILKQQVAEDLKQCRQGAEEGVAVCQFILGWAYKEGAGVEKDAREALNWWRKAAEQGHANAKNYLGLAYREGAGVEKDQREAVKWFREAAEQGEAAAQYNLGLAYKEGAGVEKDPLEAVKWWRKAAEQGNEPARVALQGRP